MSEPRAILKAEAGPPRRTAKAVNEVAGLLRGPHRIFPLVLKIATDAARIRLQSRNLYSYSTTRRETGGALRDVARWLVNAQRPDGGFAAFYSLLRGYSESYPEVTGYIVPTLYDYAAVTGDQDAQRAAEKAASWLLSLQISSGAFPSGLHGENSYPSVFNSGQILQGLVRSYVETGRREILQRAEAAGGWLAEVQSNDGSWPGANAYQGVAHTYYSMVAWALAQLAQVSKNREHAATAGKNLDWVLAHARPSGWFDGINLRGHPTYLHFIAYVVQGVLECGILLQRRDAIAAAEKSAWLLLRRFEIAKHLPGCYAADFKAGASFTCLTGNAQMSCVWLRLFEVTRDLRYLNAALKMNEMLKQLLPVRGRRGVAGGVAGSFPAWGAYQPLRYISWGGKFLADALLLEQRLMHLVEVGACAS